jgi:Flp pilus assembly protein TadB
MNGLGTRNPLRQPTRQQHDGDTKPIDRIIALFCAIGLLVIVVWQVIEQVAA